MGFSLTEMATIWRMRDRGEVPCHRVRSIAEHKLQEINQQIQDLLAMRAQLERILKDWDARLARTEKGKPAWLLQNLAHDVINTTRRLTAKDIRRRRR